MAMKGYPATEHGEKERQDTMSGEDTHQALKDEDKKASAAIGSQRSSSVPCCPCSRYTAKRVSLGPCK